MKCPYCEEETTKVLETRESEKNITRRRRECSECGERFTTYEQPELSNLIVIKTDGTRQVFDKSKLIRSMQLACQKRPVSQDQLEGIAEDIESEIVSSYKKEIESEDLGNIVMKKLRKLDEVAYIRFASVYRDFKDLETFEKELKQLRNKMEEKQ